MIKKFSQELPLGFLGFFSEIKSLIVFINIANHYILSAV